MENLFENDYNPDSVIKIRPLGSDFDMFVTPRYIGHYTSQPYEDYSTRLVERLASRIDLFLDVGAHYGFYSLIVGKANKNCSIVSFEPVVENFQVLSQNILLNNLRNVKPINKAVFTSSGEKEFHISTASDNSAFIKHPATDTLRSLIVETVSLNEYLANSVGKSVLIKIDTEGAEFEILESLTEELQRNKKIYFLIEFNPECIRLGGHEPEAFLNLLDELGLDLYAIDDINKRHYKLNPERFSSWQDFLLNPNSYINLFCAPKGVIKNFIFFAHSSGLAGAELCLFELVENLIMKDCLCTVVLPGEGIQLDRYIEIGVPTLLATLNYWCSTDRTKTGFEYREGFTESTDWLLSNESLLRMIDPDIVFTNTLVIPWGALASRLLGKPHIWMVNEFGFKDHGFNFYYGLQSTSEFIFDNSDYVITLSEAIRNELFSEYQSDKVITLYRPIPISKRNLIEERTPLFRSQFRFHVLHLGTIMKSKGQEDIVRAMSALPKDLLRETELLIVGSQEPTYAQMLEDLIKQEKLEYSVRLLPSTLNVYDLLEEADVVVVCSRAEAFGRVTLESMLTGKAIIATNSGGTPELISNEINGLLYYPGDHKELSRLLRRLITSPDLRETLGNQARRDAETKFIASNFIEELLYIVDRLTEQDRTSSPGDKDLFTDQMVIYLTTLKNKLGELHSKFLELNRHLIKPDSEIIPKKSHLDKNVLEFLFDITKSIDAYHQSIHEFNVHLKSLESEYQTGSDDDQTPVNKTQDIWELQAPFLETIAKEIEKYHADLERKGIDLKELGECLAKRSSELEKASADFTRVSVQVGELSRVLDERNLQLDRERLRYEQLVAQVQLESEVTSKQINTLDKQVAISKAQIADIWTSRSWTLTRPLRKIADFIRSFLKGTQNG